MEESSSYDAAEIIAAEVLTSLLPERATWLELRGTERKSSSNTTTTNTSSSKRFEFPFTWGCKRRRSAIAVPVTWPPPNHHPNPNQSCASSPPLPLPLPPPKAEASSPATPLSFSPSESDDKDKDNPTLLPSYLSLKRKREHYLKIIQDIKRENDLLAGEIKNVKRYCDRVKDFNLKLKARKQELSHGPNQRALPSPQVRESEGVAAQFQNHDEACGQPTTSFGVASPSGSGSGSGSALGIGNRNSNSVGPSGIPDLNLPLEEEEEEEEEQEEDMGVECCEALDNKNNVSRALAAQARQKRIQICRLKNPRNYCR